MSAPIVGAKPGEVILERGSCQWRAYRIDGDLVAALYVSGRLLRRDLAGWWVADYYGKRTAVHGDPVDLLAGTIPHGWPIHPEQTELGGGRRG